MIRAVMLKGLSHPLNKLSPLTFLLTWPSVIWFYARQLLWPVGLSGFYDTPYVVKPGLSDFVVPLLAVGSIAVALGMAGWRSTGNDRRAIGFAVAWLVLPILPLLNLVGFSRGRDSSRPLLVHAFDRILDIGSLGLARLRAGQSKLFGRPRFKCPRW